MLWRIFKTSSLPHVIYHSEMEKKTHKGAKRADKRCWLEITSITLTYISPKRKNELSAL